MPSEFFARWARTSRATRRNSAPSRKCRKAARHQTWDSCSREMVGLGGLEPPTSPLSGARSSHLSYRPAKQRQILARAGFLRIREMAARVTWAEVLDFFLATHECSLDYSCCSKSVRLIPIFV